MNEKTRELIRNYIVKNIDTLHLARIKRLRNLKLNNILKNKNPYLFRCKDLNLAADLMTAVLDARLSSSEEGSFGSFLEHLAIYVSERTGGGFKTAADGIDIELVRRKTRGGEVWQKLGEFDPICDAKKKFQAGHSTYTSGKA
jgi:hypothetical protein